jgi:hypothetical protein
VYLRGSPSRVWMSRTLRGCNDASVRRSKKGDQYTVRTSTPRKNIRSVITSHEAARLLFDRAA